MFQEEKYVWYLTLGPFMEEFSLQTIGPFYAQLIQAGK